MNVNNKFISIPPYISTSWSNVLALSVDDDLLLVTLVEGGTIEVPYLSGDQIGQVFAAHANFLETHDSGSDFPQHPSSSSKKGFLSLMGGIKEQVAEIPFRFSAGGMMDAFGPSMQHNPELAQAPDLPSEILSKISGIGKVLAPEGVNAMAKAEPHCNCPHCQIARAFYAGAVDLSIEQPPKQASIEEVVTDEDLSFEQWMIQQTGDKLFVVINKLDLAEKYNVYLGEPVGCTCGMKGCEHILAVLKS